MKDYLLKIINYGHSSNQTIIESIQNNDIEDEYISKMFSHTVNLYYIYLKRMNISSQSAYSMWDVHPINKWNELNDELTELYVNLITNKKMIELNRKIQIVNESGDNFVNSFADVLIHLANHSEHHRGQISLRIRELGFEPPIYSYINYIRSFPEYW